jgi:hypothetical protein
MTNSISSGIAVASPQHPPRALLAIGVGGSIVGVLDLLYAIIVYSPSKPILIPQTIASGLLGTARGYGGGAGTAVLGVVLHFVIAFAAAAVYYAVSRKWKVLTDHAIVCGMIYGALVYGFMHVVVLPLSALPSSHAPMIYKISEFVEHWFCVGLPISFSVKRYSR